MIRTTLRRKIVKTRIPHQCLGCLDTSPAGDQMEYRAQLDEDGKFVTYYVCLPCLAVEGDVAGMDDDWYPGTLGEYRLLPKVPDGQVVG